MSRPGDPRTHLDQRGEPACGETARFISKIVREVTCFKCRRTKAFASARHHNPLATCRSCGKQWEFLGPITMDYEHMPCTDCVRDARAASLA